MIRKFFTNQLFCLLILSILLLAITAPVFAAGKTPLKIHRVKLDKKVFNPSKEETVTLSYEVTKKADVSVILYDRIGNEIKRFASKALEPGRHDVKWNGMQSDGKPATGELFLYVIEAKAGKEKFVYNPALKAGGKLVKSPEFTFDHISGEIEYVLPSTCMVRMRAGLKEGMFVRTFYDWQPQKAGRHAFKWDGKDEAGLMNLLNHPDIDLNLACYTLPANTIIVTGKIRPLAPSAKDIKSLIKSSSDPWARMHKYMHHKHDPSICHEPRFSISFPNAVNKDKKDAPEVTGKTPMRITLDPRDARHLINKRFEIMIYIDGTYFFEMEEGSSPFTFDLETKGLRPGPHVVTVNLLSYDGHLGAVSKKVIIGD